MVRIHSLTDVGPLFGDAPAVQVEAGMVCIWGGFLGIDWW